MKRLILLFLAAALLLSGCASKAPTETLIFAMDTQMSLRLYGDADGAQAQALRELIASLDKKLSVTNESSETSALNRSGASTDADVLALLAAAKALSARTNGALDVTVYPLVRLWGFTTGDYRVPTADEIAETRSRVGAERITLSDHGAELAEGTMTDFGALAKGYTAELCRAALEQDGVSGILSLGGNIQTVGSKPDGTPWSVGIQNPEDASGYLAVLSLRGSRAVVTSGDYQRYFTQDGVRYCHVLDPATGCPVQGTLRSVTVVADSGLLADGLSTALFVLGPERGAELWRQSDDFEALWIDRSGAVTVTEGLESLVSGCEFEVLRR